MKETPLYKKIQAAVVPFNCRLFRNNTGSAFQGKKIKAQINGQWTSLISNPRKIDFGLCVGSSDLIGWTSIIITPEMVGQQIAVFTAQEVKVEGNTADDAQLNFIDQVLMAGGIAGVVYGVDDALKLIK